MRRHFPAFTLLLSVVLVASFGVPARSLPSDRRTAVLGEQRFGFEVFRALAPENRSNLVFSPYALSEAIQLIVLGGRGATQTEALRKMGLTGIGAARAVAASRALREELEESTDPALRLSNVVAVADSLTVRPAFRTSVQRDLGQRVLGVDFRQPDAKSQLDEYVRNDTAPPVPEAFRGVTLPATTSLAIASALSFDGGWLRPLGAAGTMSFTRLNNTRVEVPSLTTGANGQFLPLVRRPGRYTNVILPYRGGRQALMVILPALGQFAKVQSTLNGAALEQDLLDARRTQLVFEAPTFELVQQVQKLGELLNFVGVGSAFEARRANLGGLTAKPGSYIAAGVHNTRFRFQPTIDRPPVGRVQPTDTVTVDRPFLFAVIDRPTGMILFLGRVVDPKDEVDGDPTVSGVD